MNSPSRLIAVVCGLAVVSGLSGCSRTAGRKLGVGIGGGGVIENGTSITYSGVNLTCDGKAYVVLAANRCEGSSYHGGGEVLRPSCSPKTVEHRLVVHDSGRAEREGDH